MTYDWRDDFSKSWELWRSTMRTRLLQDRGSSPDGAPETSLSVVTPRLTAGSDASPANHALPAVSFGVPRPQAGSEQLTAPGTTPPSVRTISPEVGA